MKRALLVGINAYPTAPLNGCVNDVQDMADFLVSKCDFKMDNIRVLTDERATKKAVVERLGWLLNGVRTGDEILLHLSGHGTQVATRNAAGEVDNLDEVFCPVDFDWTDETMFRDNEFNKIFSSLPEGVTFTWISDSCHSGDLFRLIRREKRKIKSMPVPPDMAWKIRIAKSKGLKPLGLGKAAANFKGLFISGCASNQTSEDAYIEEKERFNGALTYYLIDTLSGPTGLNDPMTTIVDNVRADLKKFYYDQAPQLEGNQEKMNVPFMQ